MGMAEGAKRALSQVDAVPAAPEAAAPRDGFHPYGRRRRARAERGPAVCRRYRLSTTLSAFVSAARAKVS